MIVKGKRKFCQLFFLLVTLGLGLPIAGCSNPPLKKGARSKEAPTVPFWFKVQERFSFRTPDGDFIRHPFFDLPPRPLKDEVEVVVTTPTQSPYSYHLDLVSGKKYRRFIYCKQRDVWEKYQGILASPPYAVGLIPRLLDQRGLPQKVIIFGLPLKRSTSHLEKMEEVQGKRIRSQRVRVIGGFSEQYCPMYPCSHKNKWKSRLILVAVNPSEGPMRSIRTLAQLQKEVDWEEILGHLENSNGRTIIQKDNYPAYRVVDEKGTSEALKLALAKGHFFSMGELKLLRSSCHRLYDYFWETAQFIRRGKGDKTGKMKNFATFFGDFFQKNHRRMKTCLQFVRASNLNDNLKRHWFFAHIDAFFKLNELNYVYHCPTSWHPNPVMADGKQTFDPTFEYRNCRDEQLDQAFSTLPRMFNNFYRQKRSFYRYVEYDQSVGGTHQKLHTWIFHDSKSLNCLKHRPKEQFNLFPADIEWEAFAPTGISSPSS